jgi:hypothetical protein
MLIEILKTVMGALRSAFRSRAVLLAEKYPYPSVL